MRTITLTFKEACRDLEEIEEIACKIGIVIDKAPQSQPLHGSETPVFTLTIVNLPDKEAEKFVTKCTDVIGPENVKIESQTGSSMRIGTQGVGIKL